MVTGLSANQAERESFKVDVAPGLAQQLPGQLKAEHHRSKVFSYFGDSNRLVLIAGAQSEHVDWALVYGLAERESRRLVLVLPHDAAFATMQRVPWLTEESRPEIWLYQDSALQDAPAPERSRPDTIEGKHSAHSRCVISYRAA
jgi:hypothetical protein